MGGASIVSADAETSLSDVIVRYDLGWSIEPEVDQVLADAIVRAVYSDQLPVIRQNARAYAEQFLEKNAILRPYEKMLLSLC